jgi:hypothetical protein
MTFEVLQEIFSVAFLSDGQFVVRGRRNDFVTIRPKILRVPIGQIGLVPFDTHCMERLHIREQCVRVP